ncbi:DNA-3-methyladenine glycosylase [Paraburkholderia sp. DHOC27]|uniref:DNA-3-methyladenine glycosylase family protein n=1 Tax=Paraburkholderia sp. DHOC27 TaxID=2303330 RepID=UPI00216B6399|nr:DNA-3-methyladenine glycosylase [Paraburkholderia sp. DHOC27]
MNQLSVPDIATIELPFLPPFDWHAMLNFFGSRSSAGVEAVEDGVYRRAIEWQNDSGTMQVHLHPRRACLVVTLEGAVARHADALVEPLSRMFDTATDPHDIHRCFSADPWLAPLVEAAPGLRVPGAWSAFELVIRTVVGQQVSVKAASTVTGRIVERAGKRIEDHPHEGTAWRFPTPAALAAADLTGIGMPNKRIATLQTVAAAVASGALPLDDRHADNATIRAALLALPGIGPWTVEYVAMRALRDPDAWPASDLVLMNAILKHDPELKRPGQQKARTETWRPWRAYAAIHLWHGFAALSGRVGGG